MKPCTKQNHMRRMTVLTMRAAILRQRSTAQNARGLDDDVARLTARLDHIVSVYNSQFRGIRC